MSTTCFETSSREGSARSRTSSSGGTSAFGLFPDDVTFTRSTTGRIRNVLLGKDRLATIRAQDGRLVLGIAGARRLHAVLPPPAYRVAVLDEVEEFVAAGKNAMAKHVIARGPGDPGRGRGACGRRRRPARRDRDGRPLGAGDDGMYVWGRGQR